MEIKGQRTNFVICSHIEQNLENEKLSTKENSKKSEIESVILRCKKIQKKSQKNKKNKKRGFLSLPQKVIKKPKCQIDKFFISENFSIKTKIQKSPKIHQKQKLIFSSKRKNMSFSFFKYEEDKIKIGKFTNSLHFNIEEDNDIETDQEILENALLHNFKKLEEIVKM